MTWPRISATPVESAPRLGAAPRFWATTRATRRADPVRVDRPPWPGIGPGSVAPNCRGADGGCRSRQSDTYRIESREVRYPWHPWYGRAVGIDRVVVRGGRAVFRCRVEPGQESRSVEVPQWMFDAASCHRMRLGRSLCFAKTSSGGQAAEGLPSRAGREGWTFAPPGRSRSLPSSSWPKPGFNPGV